ncbi:MAG: ABC transporter ATP-binding protein [Coriobacteriia bacterium]|nr:ABC transporter ATP-binding protein [Coriobacteriia bacterium]
MKLEIRNITYGFDPELPVQSNVSFSMETGEICCLLGANGCGKSSLFNAILGLVPVYRGDITLDGNNVRDWPARKLSRVLGYVAQTHEPPFPYKVRDVVMLGNAGRLGYTKQPKPKDYLAAEKVMHDLGIYELRNTPYSDISGGELQLVMIARALVQGPQILMLDEPTAALDYGNALRVLGVIKRLAEQQGLGVIMTTHDPDHAFMCNSKVVLLQKNDFPRVGMAKDVITEKNMAQAYDTRVKIVEYVNERNEIMRRCAPEF